MPLRRRKKNGSAPRGGVTLVGGSDAGHLPPAVREVAEHVVDVEGRAEATAVDGQAPVLTAWLFRGDREPERLRKIDALPGLVTDDANFVWVDLSEYAERDVHEVGRALGLHRNAIHAVLSQWHRPTLAVYPDHFMTSATVARLDPSLYRVHAAELDLVAGNNFLVSFHKQPLPFDERVMARARHNPELVRMDAAFMLYIMLDELLAYYEEMERRLQGGIELMEERALRDTSDEFLEHLLHFKRYVFAFFQLVDQHREVFSAFLRPDFHWVCGADVEVYFRDLQSRLARLLDTLLAAREAVNGAFDIYVSNMSHRTNQVIKVLTMVSTVLLPATVIIGLFGANITGSIHSSHIGPTALFLIMLAAIVVVSGGTLWGFRRRGWV